jgi:ACS family tartrate transporter-like MFS transporter
VDSNTEAGNPLEQAALSKAAWRLIPFVCLLYFVSFLDRVNVGFAALTMNKDLGLSAAAYGAGAGIFFLGYFLFEIPSNIILQRTGARRWIARIMVTWGLLSVCTAFVQGPTSYWIVRFLLGAAEAGFFPGIILYLTYWFPGAMRGRIMGWFLMALPLSNAIGAPVSTWLLDKSFLGLAGWQSMFVLEGIPAVLLGFVVWKTLPDGPRHAKWLSDAEATAIEAAVARDHGAGQHESLSAAFGSVRVWHLALVYLGIVTGLYGFGFWAPQIIKSMGSFSNQQAGMLTIIPYVCAGIGLYVWGRSSDRRQERHWHLVLPILLSAAGFVGAALLSDPAMRLATLGVAAVGVYAALPVFWTRPTAILVGPAAAAGIALINAVGNLGGYIGPTVIGTLQASHGYGAGLGVLAVTLVAGAALAFALPKR